MARSKIELNVSVLGQRSRVMHVVVRSTTTCAEVMLKAMQKCRVDEPPMKYQLWVVAKDNSKGRLSLSRLKEGRWIGGRGKVDCSAFMDVWCDNCCP